MRSKNRELSLLLFDLTDLPPIVVPLVKLELPVR